MIRYYTFHVWHAAIAYFDVVSVAKFSDPLGGITKIFVNQSQELFVDICAYVLAERWIKPYNIVRCPSLDCVIAPSICTISWCYSRPFAMRLGKLVRPFQILRYYTKYWIPWFRSFGELRYNAARVV